MKHTETLQKLLYKEILTRIVEDDSSVPAKRDNYLYYRRTESGKPYKIYCRRALIGRGAMQKCEEKEEIILNVNALAEGKEFMSVGTYNVSPNHNILAYSTDEEGNEYYNLVFKDLQSGELLSDRIDNIAGMEWCNDKTIYYTKYDDAWRPYQLWKHTLGTSVDSDELIAQEDDVRFRMSISRTRNDKYMIMHLGSAITDEVWFNGGNGFECIAERVNGVEYSVDHQGDEFLVLMNDDTAINFQLYAVKEGDAGNANGKGKWRKVIDHDEDITLRSVNCFKDFVVISQRRNGLPEYRIRYASADNTKGEHVIAVPETSYSIWSSDNLEYETNKFRFDYTSLVTPTTTYDYDVVNKTLEILKVRPVDEYDASNYQTKRIWATALDGTPIPMSLIARSDIDLSGDDTVAAPLHLIGYGSYGSSYDAYFSAARLSLVDRGVIVGYAHVRGGGEFGRKWKLNGKLDKKMNTFQDFIACSKHLIDSGLTDNEHLGISGGSAGGLLMGAVMNMRADLYHAVIADVPFVDVLNTILDETLPLTAGEWEEWGDPRTMNEYFTIKSYSPYDNVSTQKYPNVLLEGGLNDARVKYWEPAKFAAKLREMKRNYKHLYDDEGGDNTILLKTNMGAGHGGASGRYGRIKEISFEYAWLLDQLGMIDVKNPNLTCTVDDDDDEKKED